ncbi:MAG: 50S ribosomal protein L1 [Spirochaetales bacterium]|nr:50S ribosomal protein L1 [Spirochaetales bacterium]
MKHGKKYTEKTATINRQEQYQLDKAVELVKSCAFAKFDETVELAMKLNLKSSHTVRDTLVFPNQFGREKRILVFAKGEKAEEARQNGATFVGDNDLIEKIKGGWLDFDVAVATPDLMKDVGKLGQILGRRGLMPNPKTQTVTFEIKGAIAELKKGRVEYRADKTGVVHMAVGKVSMDIDKISENVKTVIKTVNSKKPGDIKGEFIKSITLSSTMGPGIKLAQDAKVLA